MCVRPLAATDEERPATLDQIGPLLQILIGADDRSFVLATVESLAARVRWIRARDQREATWDDAPAA